MPPLAFTRSGSGAPLVLLHALGLSRKAWDPIGELGRSPGYDAALAGTARRRVTASGPITAPVTIAFGSRDLLLRRGSRRLGQLPPQTQAEALPGCGHVPMADDPAAVAALVISSADRMLEASQ